MPIEFLSAASLEEQLDISYVSYKDSAWQDYPFEREVLKKSLEPMIGKPEYFTCMYRKNGKIIGYFFATLGSFLWSSKLMGMENGVYIEKQHRGGIIAYSMYQEFIKWCKAMKVEPFVEIYFGKDEDNKKVYSFFIKAGMAECGRVLRGGKQWVV